jgi:DNA-binding ferritin-like protein (Dps family)
MNITTLVEKVVGDLGDKRRWRAYKARANALPEPYRSVIGALERYLTYYGGIVKGDVLVAMIDDLADLFEQAAADGTPVRALVGDDPVGFAEEFLRNYADGQWINKERARLVSAVDAAVAVQEEQ